MDIQDVLKLEMTIGGGEDCFTMERGSFRYDRKTFFSHELKRVSCRKLQAPPGAQRRSGSAPGAPSPRHWEITFLDEADRIGHTLLISESGGVITVSYDGSPPPGVNRFKLTLPTATGEHYWGCGETHSKLDLKGERVRIWVAEHQNIKRTTDKVEREKRLGKNPHHTLPFSQYEAYYAEPTFTSSGRYAVHVDTSRYSVIDFARDGIVTLELEEPPRITIVTAATYEELSGRLSALLGRQRPLPDWVYDGAILGVQRGTAEVEEKLDMLSNAGAKVCGIWCQDWSGCRRTGFGYQVMWNWEADTALYPGLAQKIRTWRERGIRFLGYINPFLAIEKPLYREASAKGYCVKDKDGKDYLVTITTFPAAMIDFTNPAACEWYKALIKRNMIEAGMGGWMADFGEYLPTDAVLWSGESAEALHNRWPAIWARLNREAIQESGREGDVFFFTRAGYTDTIRYSTMMWTGDQHVDWSRDDGIPSVIPATLSLAMSGYGITHSDAGGYTTNPPMTRTKELLLRWLEMNAFSPLLRTHEGNRPQDNAQFYTDEELLSHTAYCSRVHAALKDYLLSCEKELSSRGIPVMRPLFYHYDEEPYYAESTEYLLGRSILVAPVLEEGAVARKCYLPRDEWEHIFTGDVYPGGTYDIASPIGCPPVFFKRGSPLLSEAVKSIRKLYKSRGKQ